MTAHDVRTLVDSPRVAVTFRDGVFTGSVSAASIEGQGRFELARFTPVATKRN